MVNIMTILDILTYPDGVLIKKCSPVQNIDGVLQQTIGDMAETMYHAPGLGLAANQVGIQQRLLIYDVVPRQDGRDLRVLINPTIVDSEGEMISENEGCLSIPDFRADVKRASRILVEGYDRNGSPLRLEADGLLAIVLQHEIDHLNGTLFVDHLSSLKRGLFKRRIQKKLRQQK
jgi:peptide deformylase